MFEKNDQLSRISISFAEKNTLTEKYTSHLCLYSDYNVLEKIDR